MAAGSNRGAWQQCLPDKRLGVGFERLHLADHKGEERWSAASKPWLDLGPTLKPTRTSHLPPSPLSMTVERWAKASTGSGRTPSGRSRGTAPAWRRPNAKVPGPALVLRRIPGFQLGEEQAWNLKKPKESDPSR